ncbi:Fe-S-oxidoreductase [Geothermobacter hydrogeniphilus]|uniref:Fe-S-oxidoreductase n=1 Tax=Geothermobacter hydrogeniphilus TaxID=1969733 RepID=A0A2K2HDP0_9BACT|nr:YkgJ family cysteine cluster protein [Geothermobacter hydrogeniphilus]PNU21415.1 Fe-S-oxidoreductase [Geothermobacter hydrogeniphilus]
MKKAHRQKKTTRPVCPETPDTWVRYHGRLCDSCSAGCCRLEVEVDVADLVRMGLIDDFDVGTPAKLLAKRLRRDGVIEHFNHKREIFSLTRRANADCIYLHPRTRRCTIYEKRPVTCRNHPRIGPRPGYCAYRQRA